MIKTACLLAASALLCQGAQPTARQIVSSIQQNLGTPWMAPTVDTFKAGDPDTPVTGIAVTMMATFDVIKRAAAAGDNFVITHEPTFYNHQDQTGELASANDPVLAEKEKFIRDHHMVVWRFHDNWHHRNPDGILVGVVKALGWEKYQQGPNSNIFIIPPTTVRELADSLHDKLNIGVLRAVGDPNRTITKVGLMPGAAGASRQIKMLESDAVQVLVIGETQEWETVEYVDDATAEGRDKALIILSHIPSEQPGMDECTHWLKTFVKDVPVQFVPAKQPFWTVR